MKRVILMLIALMLCGGCASAIYKNGRYHSVLKTGTSRGQVRAALGEPVESGEENRFGFAHYDVFIVNGPVCDNSRAAGSSMGASMTLGFSEFFAFPQALWWSLTNRGQKRLTVRYSEGYDYSGHFVVEAKCTRESNAESANACGVTTNAAHHSTTNSASTAPISDR